MNGMWNSYLFYSQMLHHQLNEHEINNKKKLGYIETN